MTRINALLIGHAFGPDLGSEPGNTWNWAWELSKYINVTVLAHPQYRESVYDYLKAFPNKRLKIIWIGNKLSSMIWKPGFRDRTIRLHYYFWQKAALKRALQAVQTRKFDLIHYISWSSVTLPPILKCHSIPLIWGPIGGGQKSPNQFKHYFGNHWLKECLRNLRIDMLHKLPQWRHAVREATIVLSTNFETTELLHRVGKDSRFFLDVGISSGFGLSKEPLLTQNNKETFSLIWAGRCDSIKALPIALEAVATLDIPITLIVAGDGPLLHQWKSYAVRLNISDRVIFLGKLPYVEMKNLFRSGDAFIFTSLRDTFGSVVLEALAFGLPVIVPDHQGVGTFITSDVGIKVPITRPEETVEGFASAILTLYQNIDLRRKMSKQAWQFAQNECWENRAVRMLSIYEEAIMQRK